MKNSGVNRLLAIANGVFFAGTLFVNYLSAALPLNGKTPGQLSDEIPNLFVPAGITFSIWGIIYLLQLIFIVYQFIVVFRAAEPPKFFERIGVFYILSCTLNSAWIFAWHFELVWLSLIVMALLLVTLILLYLRLEPALKEMPASQRWMAGLPFSVYLGWITVATVANATAFLVKYGWDGWGIPAMVWTIVMLAVSAAVTFAMLLTRRDTGYAAVIVWALAGIMLKRSADSPETGTPIMIAAGAGIAIIIAGAVIALVRKRKTAS
ncbi:MAG: LPXTG cell wall anchor domain-containing protein [Brevinematales bacterium]|nr:LPXTG cell wall anchor domain-containing protein [Brevinematales bacterium]